MTFSTESNSGNVTQASLGTYTDYINLSVRLAKWAKVFEQLKMLLVNEKVPEDTIVKTMYENPDKLFPIF